MTSDTRCRVLFYPPFEGLHRAPQSRQLYVDDCACLSMDMQNTIELADPRPVVYIRAHVIETRARWLQQTRCLWACRAKKKGLVEFHLPDRNGHPGLTPRSSMHILFSALQTHRI